MWTRFMDMHSGGGTKEKPYEYIYIEAPLDEATVIFYNRFGHNPHRVSCTCCGSDYSMDEEPTLRQATAYNRNCANLETPRDPVTRLFKQPDDPWFKEHYYLEPGEEAEAERRGWEWKPNVMLEIAKEYPDSGRRYRHMTVEEYCAQPDVLVIHAAEIKPEERSGEVPEQGYVWQD